MRRLSAWWAAGVVAAAAVGCGPGKELPGEDEVPRRAEPTGPPPDPYGPAPAASEPEAKAVLDRAVKAIAGDTPGGLEKAKASRVTYQGSIQRPGDRDMSEATRRIETVWPDRGHVVDEYRGGLYPTMTFHLRRPYGWAKNGTTPIDRDRVEVGRILRTDLLAQHWLPLGLPLADPGTVAFGKAATPGGTAVKVAVTNPPGPPVFLVTFDDKTGVPVRVEYHPVEGNSNDRVHKVFALAGHKPSAGYLLPGEAELTQNGRLGEKWAAKSWEFPEKLDESLFDPPKQ